MKVSEKIETLKHYFGITYDGELIARGIEIRRHDTPNFIKEFQTELLFTLFDCKDSTDLISKGYENALLIVTTTIDKVMTGDIQLEDLVVTKLLGQGLDKFKSLFPHVSAPIRLANEGRSTIVGEGTEYILQIRAIRIPSAESHLEILSIMVRILSMTTKSTLTFFWKRPKQYWDILVLIGASMETFQRKIRNGGTNLKRKRRGREIESI